MARGLPSHCTDRGASRYTKLFLKFLCFKNVINSYKKLNKPLRLLMAFTELYSQRFQSEHFRKFAKCPIFLFNASMIIYLTDSLLPKISENRYFAEIPEGIFSEQAKGPLCT